MPVAGGLWAFQGAVRVRCQANKLSKQAKVWCLMLCGCGGGGAVLVYTSKGLAWFGAVVVLSKQARVWCLVLDAVLVQWCGFISKQGLGAWFLCWVGAGAVPSNGAKQGC